MKVRTQAGTCALDFSAPPHASPPLLGLQAWGRSVHWHSLPRRYRESRAGCWGLGVWVWSQFPGPPKGLILSEPQFPHP